MDRKKIIDIIENINKSTNSELLNANNEIINEFEETKKIIIDLTSHLEMLEKIYTFISNELEKRNIK